MFPEAILGDLAEEEMAEELAKVAPPETNGAATSAVEAAMTVDGGDTSSAASKKQKKKKKKKAALTANLVDTAASAVTILPSAHTDSVLSLSWNRVHRSLLASSSADSTIKLWDLSSPTCHKAIRSFSLHDGEKVQSIAWNPAEPTILLSGAWGGSIKVFDTRNPDAAIGTKLPAQPGARGTKKANPDVEVLHWDPHSESHAHFYVATGNGQVLYYDSRDLSKPVWTLDAHDGPCSALDVNEYIPGCIVTGGVDKQTKVWNITPGKGRGISLCMSRDFGVVSTVK
jgi:periodic tryptophan protein 1